MMTFGNRVTALAAALAVLATARLSTARGDDKVDHAAFVATRTSSLVTVKFVMKSRWAGWATASRKARSRRS